MLFSIDNERYYSDEFSQGYKKNLSLVEISDSSFDDYLKLFIDFKLKVKESKLMGYDTLQKFRSELNQYKNSLITPYLRDEKVTAKLIIEAYDRLKEEVNVSHILIFLKPTIVGNDTLTVYNKLIEARNLIVGGSDFGEIAKKYSNDPSVQDNLGEIGYFTALQMVYPFENTAYKTSINEISLPFRTKFGYHILKVNDKRVSRGEVEVAHIMLKKGPDTEKKIDAIYSELIMSNTKFEEVAKNVSEDRASAINGGKLNKFGSGQMAEEFSNVAFSLKKENEMSKPFKSQFGWHIIKLLKKYPVESFDRIKADLKQKIEKDSRSNLIGKSVIEKLLKKYDVRVNEKALKQFNIDNWKENPEKFHQNLISINNEEIPQIKFINYLKLKRNSSIENSFLEFKTNEVIEYYKNEIEHTNPDFASVFKEFKEGLLLFELLEKQVWERAKNNEELLKYFNNNKEEKYKGKELRSIKGIIISDYQNFLEVNLMKKLHKKYEVKINKSEKRRIKKANL
ncbi:MAG: peptidylprolyl isomerase [Lutibacter sp.]|nr:peptidylprolyl isomerase [Lutibacter sp.]